MTLKILFFHNLFMAPSWEITDLTETKKNYSLEFWNLSKESEFHHAVH